MDETIKIFMVVFVIGLFFWLWMLVDCIYYESKEWDKIIWMCVIVLLNVFGAILYLLLRFKTNRKSSLPSGLDKFPPPR
jgi:magnesium-transporting ATPase (P-type)